ncbi:hypothetical protein D4R51_01015 [bacterium]|nr:MAG: hypothetical protein D4R51_01015 [bacterium]
MGSFITSDQPMGPPANVGDQRNLWRAAQELNNRLGDPIGNEPTKEWLARGLAQGKISSEDAMRALNRVVNG